MFHDGKCWTAHSHRIHTLNMFLQPDDWGSCSIRFPRLVVTGVQCGMVSRSNSKRLNPTYGLGKVPFDIQTFIIYLFYYNIQEFWIGHFILCWLQKSCIYWGVTAQLHSSFCFKFKLKQFMTMLSHQLPWQSIISMLLISPFSYCFLPSTVFISVSCLSKLQEGETLQVLLL